VIRTTTIVLALLLFQSGQPLAWKEFLAHRAEYSGKTVILKGWYRRAYEVNGLFQSRKSCERWDRERKVWINDMPGASFEKTWNRCVPMRIEGIYDSTAGGHSGAYSGAIDVKRAEILAGDGK
jgi:hypothetical protein